MNLHLIARQHKKNQRVFVLRSYFLFGLFEWSVMCFREGVCLPADGEVGVSELDPMEPRPRP